ncbi:MAG: cation:dicarboxylase symporter family transporter [Gammaproteobacteria bacterium]|nr:cation:dicarboxylase symporter family transporter [Gammaproteobacteria bacterium]
MFRKMPFILVMVILAVLALSPFLTLETKQVLYAISLTIKSSIVLLLPFIIFGLLFKTMIGLAQRATSIIALILLCVCCSNTVSTFLSHYMGIWIYHFDLSIIRPHETTSLTPAWTFQFPKLIANDKAMFAGIILGIVLGSLKSKLGPFLARRIDRLVTKVLNSFAYFIPLFVAGFVVKLQFDGVMQTIVKDYTVIFALIALAQFSYILVCYALLNRLQLRKAFRCVRNMLPAAIAGFSTMSSAAVMPLTIAGTESNAKNKDLAGSVIPATVNIHLVGDCFAIPILAYAVMKSFGMPEPTLMTYLVFVFYFVIAKFSVAAIPGGGIIVMLPILESCLGFTAEMLSLITALYILFDPVITCANVLGNGAFALLIDKLAPSPVKQKITLNDRSFISETTI